MLIVVFSSISSLFIKFRTLLASQLAYTFSCATSTCFCTFIDHVRSRQSSAIIIINTVDNKPGF